MLLIGALALASGAAYVLWRGLGSPTLPKGGIALTIGEVYNGVKLALAIVAGIGAVVALTVAYRKQRLQEEDDRRAESNSRRDDTKLYNERFKAAAEQIGSDKAAIRLSGVYAFQALADDWKEGRQMCVEVLSAYLRMPFAGPSERPSSEVAFDSNGNLSIIRNPSSVDEHNGYEELQVRLTIQGVLASRLRRPRKEVLPSGWTAKIAATRRPDPERYGDPAWPGISAVLTGATLVDADFHNCAFVSLDCEGTVFYGTTNFNGSHFTESADFHDAIFVGTAVFSGATFNSHADFTEANFILGAYFNKVTTNHDLEFNSSWFHYFAQFNHMNIEEKGNLYFTGATFKGSTTFTGTTHPFRKDLFADATAHRKASFKDLPSPWKNVGGKLVIEASSDGHPGAQISRQQFTKRT
jgi:hypothetical protein